MAEYKTQKGTVLPLLNLKGKDYLEVKWRLVWFREDHPDWSIETEFIQVNATSALAKTTVKNEQGRILATGHKFEDQKGFPDFHEKAESSSMGRALALLGYGTQFCADELDEGERIVDSPLAPRPSQPIKATVVKLPPEQAPQPLKLLIPEVLQDEDYGEFVCMLPKYLNTKIKDIGEHALDNYIGFFKKKGNMSPSTSIFVEKADAYLKQHEFDRDGKAER